jgi:2-polyprenyl-3-methyl-5-hydroxy-6-metoxy-1,4-benzoquinol methylase
MTAAEKVYKNLGNAEVTCRVGSPPAEVLDIGCGAGDNAERLDAAGFTVDGITLSQVEADLAARVCRRVVVHNLEAGLPDLGDQRYDCCLCSHVLEHICWPGPLLAGVRERLRPNGRLIVALPNLLQYKYRWRLLTAC